MRAMQLTKTAPVETAPLQPVEMPLPEPGLNELRIKVLACGVCHTDIHEIEGDIKPPHLPLIVGHEIVGVVDKLGAGVKEPKIGTRVGIPWLASTCGKCHFCKTSRENLCEEIKFTGFHTDGGYAQYTICRAGFCYPLPENLAIANLAPLLCAGVIGYRSLKRADVQPETNVGLYGFGASAHICLQILKHWHCWVAVFTRTKSHQEHARELGADWVGTAKEKPPYKLASAIIFAPAGELVPLALSHLDKGATLALAGIHMSPIPEMDYSLIYHERKICSVANSTRQDVIELLSLAEEIPLKTTVTTFPLEQANQALLAVKKSGINGAAVLLNEIVHA
ncbi:MAG: zinc-dependent alcohol dehydrogenase family protein [candidate division WOR-3 bacterium]